tara:strand:+ start:554 stop:736 length:183 start_codon:yes stop_codon:yes gene_type:complete
MHDALRAAQALQLKMLLPGICNTWLRVTRGVDISWTFVFLPPIEHQPLQADHERHERDTA